MAIIFTLIVSVFPITPVRAETEPPTASVAAAPWLDAQESTGIIYILYTSPSAIKRYQISTETWLSDIALTSTPTAFRVTSDALYIAFGRRASRFTLEGANETHLLNTNYDILSLHVVNSILLVNWSLGSYGNFTSVNLSTGAIVDTKSYYTAALVGVSMAPTLGKLFGRSTGINPSDIAQVYFSPTGLFNGEVGSPYHGDYPDASMTWVSPNEQIVVDSAGIIYNTADLTYRGSLAGQVDDLAFYGDLLIAIRTGKLFAFSSTFLETGRVIPVHLPLRIFISGETIYSLYSGIQGPQVEKIAVNTLKPPTPGTPIDPNGLNYAPDKVILGKDETVYLLSRQLKSIFRWSVPQRRYLGTIPLLDVPYTIAYAANENRIYVAYSNGSIYQIRLDESLLETVFASLPTEPCGLATAGSFVFACDESGAWVTHSVFAPSGETLSKKDWNYYSAEYIWNAARQKMYFFRDQSSPNDLIWEDISANGVIGTQKDSPYHSDAGIQHPIRVKADGSIVLLGSGRIYDGLTLSQINTLSNSISDAGWKDDTLVTLRAANGNSELQKWTPVNYGVAKSQAVMGNPISLLPIQEGWLVVTSQAGKPYFSIGSEDLALSVYPSLADFSATFAGGSPLGTRFTNLSVASFYNTSLWDFGDGTTSTEKKSNPRLCSNRQLRCNVDRVRPLRQ